MNKTILMPIPQSKIELLDQIRLTYQKLKVDLEKIPAGSARKNGIEGNVKGTKVSPADVVAYLVGWGELVIKWHERKSNNLLVDFPETGFKWNELGLLAQKFHKDYEANSITDLMKQLDDVVQKIISIIEEESNAALYGIPWYEKWTFGRMIQLNTSSPYKSNRTKIRKWLREEGIL